MFQNEAGKSSSQRWWCSISSKVSRWFGTLQEASIFNAFGALEETHLKFIWRRKCVNDSAVVLDHILLLFNWFPLGREKAGCVMKQTPTEVGNGLSGPRRKPLGLSCVLNLVCLHAQCYLMEANEQIMPLPETWRVIKDGTVFVRSVRNPCLMGFQGQMRGWGWFWERAFVWICKWPQSTILHTESKVSIAL